MRQVYFRLASIRRRAAAKVIDLVTCVCILRDLLPMTGRWLGPDWEALAFLPPAALWLLGDGFGGRSIGKRMLGLKVVHVDHGSPCGFVESFVRNVTFAFRVFELGMGFGYGVARNLTDSLGMVVIDLRPAPQPEDAEGPETNPPPPSSGSEVLAEFPRG